MGHYDNSRKYRAGNKNNSNNRSQEETNEQMQNKMPDYNDQDFEESKDVCFDTRIADTVLAKDLNRMTFQERNMIFDEVHGVPNLKDEMEPSKLLESLEQMNLAIDSIQSKGAYAKAVTLRSQYVLHNKALRIRFLRADAFDPAKAAQRFINYLDFYHELFGTIALMRPIYFDDLNKEEQNRLREGSIQLMPCRDRTERRILTRIGLMGGPGESQYSPTCMRVNLYMMQVLSTDEWTQKCGCVMIFHSASYEKETENYGGEMKFLQEPNIKEKIRKFIASFPVRVAAVHFCFPQTLQYRLAASALSLISPTMVRVRIRTHLGSQNECQYALSSYGIPGDQLPMTSSGRIKTLNHHRWIKFQREKEVVIQMGLPPFEGVDCPLGMDVRIGNAGNNASYFKNTPGNVKYRELLANYYRVYEEACDSQEKTRLTWKVLEELQKCGGRFLVRDRRGWWTVASSGKSREKIAQDFRETRKKIAHYKSTSSKKQRRSPPVAVQAVVSSPVAVLAEPRPETWCPL